MDLQPMLNSPLNPINKTAIITKKITTGIVHNKIRDLDLEPIKFKLVKEQGWPLQKADSVEKLYKAYLLLFALYPSEEHVPTHDIDEMWHSHILDTQKYMADCMDIFGYYLHHYPYLGLLDAEDAALAGAQFAATRKRFIEVSGLDPAEVASDCGGGGGCGGGGSSCGGGGSSCSSGGSSCSSGGGDSGGGHHDGGGDAAIIPIISSCTSSVPSTPLKDEWKRKKDKPSPANSNPSPVQKKKPFWRRIIGALRRETDSVSEPSRWDRSVDPRRMRKRGRPNRATLLALLEVLDTGKATKH
ncbi:MAG: glycine-rich domain-containing protein-like [Alphaproteobacteria bacterium]